MTRADRIRRWLSYVALAIATVLLLAYLHALHGNDPDSRRIGSVAYFKDQSARLSVTEVMSQRFVPITANHRGGYDTAAHWFRIKLAPQAGDSDLVLEISPPVLDHVTLFVPTGRGRWKMMESGDTVPFADRPTSLVPISFPIHEGAMARTLYLRVTSDTSTSLTLAADRPADAEARGNAMMAMHIIYFGLLGMGLLLGLLRLAENRSGLSVCITAFFATYLLTSLEGLGYGPILFDGPAPGFHSMLYFVATTLTVLFSMLFQRYYLNRHRPNRVARQFVDILMVFQASLMIALAMGEYQIVSLGTVACSLLFLPLLVLMLATARLRDRDIQRALLVIYGCYITISIIWLISRIGLLATLADTRHFIEIFGINNLILALLLIVLERREEARHWRRTVLSLETAQAAQQSQGRNADIQANFLHMLMHEVRNHLSVLQLSLPDLTDPERKARLGRAIRDLNRALAKVQHTVWLDEGTWPARPRKVTVLETLDAVIEDLGLSDRIAPEGEGFEAEIEADPAMVEALLAQALQAAVAMAGPDDPVSLTVSQPQADQPCRIDIGLARGAARGADPDLDLAHRLAKAAQGSLALAADGPDRLHLTLTLPP